MTFYFDRRTRDDVFLDSIKGSTMYHCWYNEGKTVLCCCYFFHSEGEKRWDYSEMKVSIDASIIVDDLKRIFKTKRASISKFISYFEFLIFDRLYLNLILTFVGMIKERMEFHS